jgi:hypothetical protein
VARSIKFDFPLGGKPTVEIAFTGSWYEFVAATYPDTTAKDELLAAPIAAGSFFMNQVNTATRSLKTVESFTLTYNLGIQMQPGPGGVSQYQLIIGAVRTPSSCMIEFTLDSEAATTTPTEGGSDTVFYHALFTLNGAAAGQRVALYFPSLCYVENTAVQQASNNLNRKRVTMQAYKGATTTSDLTKSCFRMGFN